MSTTCAPKHTFRSTLLAVCLLSGLCFISSLNQAWAIAQGYKTDDTDLRPGMVVALADDSDGSSTKVTKATTGNQQKIVGIVTNADSSLVVIGSSQSQVFVEDKANVSAYVSDANGDVKKGDLLAVSPLSGILMKAGEQSRQIVGVGLQDFDRGSAETYRTADNQEVLVQKMGLAINIRANDQLAASDSTLVKLGKKLTGKEVSELRLIIALAIFLIIIILEGSILYGSVSSTIVSLGRNPMAKVIIRREFIRVISIVLLVFVMGLASIYAILWL